MKFFNRMIEGNTKADGEIKIHIELIQNINLELIEER